MNRFGIPVELKYVPSLDPDFMPLLRFNRAFLADAKKPVSIAVERDRGQIAAYHTFPRYGGGSGGGLLLHGSPGQDDPVDEGRLQGICGR